jgi:hypothetical protein
MELTGKVSAHPKRGLEPGLRLFDSFEGVNEIRNSFRSVLIPGEEAASDELLLLPRDRGLKGFQLEGAVPA